MESYFEYTLKKLAIFQSQWTSVFENTKLMVADPIISFVCPVRIP